MLACPVCDSVKWMKRYKISDWDIVDCTECGFAKIDPLPDRGSRAECYSQEKVIERNIKQKSSSQKFSRVMKQMFGRLIKRNKSGIFYNKLCRYLSPKARILDVGCGDGGFLRIAKNNFICTGIEISEYLASLARRQNDIKVITGNFLNTDFTNEKYDGITLISLLEHLDDPINAMKKCFELLNQGSILLMKTVNYNCLNRKIRKESWSGFRPPDHMIYFNPSNLKSFLKKTGFSKIKISAMPFNDNMYCEAWK